MVVRFEFMWQSIPALLIPLLFVVIQMTIIRVWMYSAPKRERERPNYSLHVMREPEKPKKKMTFAPQQPVIPARRTPMFTSSFQVASAPHVYGSRGGSMQSSSLTSSGWGTPGRTSPGMMTPSRQFQQFQAGRSTPQYGRPSPQYH